LKKRIQKECIKQTVKKIGWEFLKLSPALKQQLRISRQKSDK